jgi:hypothetical protein
MQEQYILTNEPYSAAIIHVRIITPTISFGTIRYEKWAWSISYYRMYFCYYLNIYINAFCVNFRTGVKQISHRIL